MTWVRISGDILSIENITCLTVTITRNLNSRNISYIDIHPDLSVSLTHLTCSTTCLLFFPPFLVIISLSHSLTVLCLQCLVCFPVISWLPILSVIHFLSLKAIFPLTDSLELHSHLEMCKNCLRVLALI